MRPDAILRAVLFVLSYFILVGIVVFGAVWIKQQFDEQTKSRCDLAKTQLQLIAATDDVFSRIPTVSDTDKQKLADAVATARRQLQRECG